MSFIDEVLDFINRRFQKDSDWTTGNCLWFAYILTKRFSQLEVYYLPVQGHFVAGYKQDFHTVYFDWTGQVFPKEQPWLFQNIQLEDDLWYSHLIRDCFM